MKLSFNQRLEVVCKGKNNYLCIGLDIDPDKFPSGRDTSLDGMETFGKEVIDGTIDFCPAYKPNLAFFERFGSHGYALLESLVDHINGNIYDNSVENLRWSSSTLNNLNNGAKNYRERCGKFETRIKIFGNERSKTFKTEKEAKYYVKKEKASWIDSILDFPSYSFL